ncbi:MAG: HAD family phosphatase [Pseudomonadota bacterium]
MNAELVVFDCDGVLADSEMLYARIEIARIHEFGWQITAEDHRQLFTGLPSAEIFRAVSNHTGKPVPPDFFDRLHADFSQALETLSPVPGAVETVLGLSVPRAVASNSSASGLARKLAACGLTGAFGDLVISMDQVAAAKPAPDIYLLAAERACTPPAQAIAVEDSANGIRAARAAGMHVIGFTGGGHHGPDSAMQLLAAGAHETVASMPDLAMLLDQRTTRP